MSLKRRLKDNQMTIGSWITTGNMIITEIMAKSGFDWLAVDMEHSAVTIREAQDAVRIIELSGVIPLIRVGKNDAHEIKRAMDAGAHGVIVPMVNSREEAEHAVAAVKCPPVGTRGVGLARAQGYGMDFAKYKQWVNKESVVIVQIEHIDAVEALEEIINVDGVDGTLIGPYDLSASMGRPGDFGHKDVIKAIKRYSAVCRKYKKPAGFHVIPPDHKHIQEKIKEGFRFIGFSLDTLFLGQKIKDELGTLRSKRKSA